jgi:three-Cys-motif partner protein
MTQDVIAHDLGPYANKPAAFVKHQMLRKYLQELAYKIGQTPVYKTINYVEGFAGPWRSVTSDLSDTSPHVAITALREAREGLLKRGYPVEIRCAFVEKDRANAEQLRESLKRYPDIVTEVFPGEFERHVADICSFVSKAYRPFTFVFLDPTGWTGFPLDKITSVLQIKPGEVLINYMTKHITRFIDEDHPGKQQSFDGLFGSPGYRKDWTDLEGSNLIEARLSAYREQIRIAGGYAYVVSADVLDATCDQTLYDLVYGTRNIHGLRVFRDIECQAIDDQRLVRAISQQSQRLKRKGQGELFAASDMGDGDYTDYLLGHYSLVARSAVIDALRDNGTVLYDDLELIALMTPMTCTRFFRRWLSEWKKEKLISYAGLPVGKRVPEPKENHWVEWAS